MYKGLIVGSSATTSSPSVNHKAACALKVYTLVVSIRINRPTGNLIGPS